MKIKDILISFADYYNATRGVGHSHVAIDGLERNDNAMFVVGFNHNKGMLQTDINKCVSVGEFHIKMKGRNNPIIFDNYALHLIFADAYKEIVALEREVEILKNKMRRIKEIAED